MESYGFIVFFLGILAPRFCLGHGPESHLICKQVGDISGAETEDEHPAMTRRQLQGVAGSPGARGPAGPPGTVDYERVNTMVNESMGTEIAKLRRETEAACDKKINKKIKKLTEEFQTKLEESRRVSTLDSLKSQMSEWNTRFEELFTNLSKSPVEYKEKLQRLVPTGPCKIKYAGKCFWVIITGARANLRFLYARRLCSEEDQGMIGNIYSEEHYNAVAAYARTLIPESRSDVYFWTGMKYDSETNVFSSYEGSTDLYVKWRANYPTMSQTYMHVLMMIRSKPSHSDQGMFNYPTNSQNYGVLCQTSIIV